MNTTHTDAPRIAQGHIQQLINQWAQATEAQLTLAVAALLIKLGERSIEITADDVRRAQDATIRIDPGAEGGVNFKIL